MILAARLAIESMVEELIQSEADINACYENGKSALYWAANVNNVDAINTLLGQPNMLGSGRLMCTLE